MTDKPFRMTCNCYVLMLFFLLIVSFFSIRPCLAFPQSPSLLSTPSSPNPTGAAESSASQGNVIAPNGGPRTGTETGLAVSIVLGVTLLGIIAWLFFECSPGLRNRKKKRTSDFENNKKTIEPEGDAPAERLVELSGRHTPVPTAGLAAPSGQRDRTDEQRAQDESGDSDMPITTAMPDSPQQTADPYRFLRDSSIRVGESATTPEASFIHVQISTPTATSVSGDPELSNLRHEMAMVQEERTRLERLEQLHALRQREEQLQKAIYLRQYARR